jgi:hypothetical protein
LFSLAPFHVIIGLDLRHKEISDMPANVDAMVRAGVEAYRAGKKAEARTLLERAIELDGYNETAWLWLSAVVESPEEQQTCLENVLTINPNNDRAKQGLKSLGINPDSIAKPAASSSPAFQTGTFDFDSKEDVFSSPTPSSSYSSNYSSSPAPSAPAPKPAVDDIFGDVDFSADASSFQIDDNLFGDDPYEDVADDDIDIDDSIFDDDIDHGDAMYADINTLEEFTSKVDGIEYDDSIFDDDPLAPPAPVAAPMGSRSSMPAPAPMIGGGTIGRGILRQIPAEIEVGRMPGTNEPAPSYHYLILGVLVLANLAALGFIAMQFVG